MQIKDERSLGHVMATRISVDIITRCSGDWGGRQGGGQTGKPVFRQTEMKVLKVN